MPQKLFISHAELTVKSIEVNKLKKSSVRTSLIVILIALSTIVTLQNSVKAQSEPNIYVSDQFPTGSSDFLFYTNTTTVGFKFNATVNVSNVSNTNVYGWQVRMNYNSTFLNATRAWLAPVADPDYIFFGVATIRPSPALTLGSVLVGDNSLSVAVNFTTPKKLGIVEFEIIASPPPGTGSKLSSILEIDNIDTFLLDFDLNEILIVKTNGLYEFNYSPPATEISISTTATTISYGGRVNISGTISTVPPNASQTFAGVTVSIWHRVGSSGDFTVFSLVTTNNSSGYFDSWLASGVAEGEHQFRASWSGNATYSGATSSIVSVTVTIPAGSPTISVNNAQTGTNNFIFYTSTTAVGFKFNATVNVNNGTNVASWQVTLNYNATYLNVTGAWIPSTDAQYIFVGLSTFPVAPVFTSGSVLIGDLTVPTQGVNFTTPKKLAIIEFEITAAPPTGVGNKLSSALDINNPATYILDTDTIEIPTARTNGLYELRSGSKPASQITIGASPTSVAGGATVKLSGTINVTAPNARVTIWHKVGTGTFANLTTVTTNSSSMYTYSWTSSGAGTHQFKANWTGSVDYLGAESTAVSVTVTKASSTITVIASPTSVTVGENVTLSGTITPIRANVNVTITSGTTTLGTVKTGTDGTYTFQWKPTAQGTYQITAAWLGDDTFNSATSTAITVTVEAATAPTDYTIYYIIAAIVIIVIILIILYWFMRRRRESREEEHK